MMEKKESAIDAFMRKTMLGHIGDIEAANTKLSDAEARIAEITKWRDEWKDMATELKGLVEEWQARAEAAEALLKEAGGMLQHFTSHYDIWMDRWSDDEECTVHSRHTYGQLRAARAIHHKIGVKDE